MDTIDRGFHLLPVELMAAIFLRCVPHPTRKNPGPLLSRKHPAVVLSHVCHDWRQIAVSTPLLWSTMHIETPHTLSSEKHLLEQWVRNCEAVRETIAAWTERSAGCPLTIALNVHGKCRPGGTDPHMNILTDVVRSSKKWREVHITLGLSRVALRSLESATEDLTADDLPILASLSMTLNLPHRDMPNVLSSFSSPLMESRLLTAPNLREVTLGGNWNMTAGLFANLHRRWAPLTELTVDPCGLYQKQTLFDMHHALNLLKSFPQLVKVCFKFVPRYPEANHSHAPYIPLTLPHLQSLSLRGIPPVAEFAHLLTLPSLTAMYLVFDTYKGVDPNVVQPTPLDYSDGIVELLRQFGPQVTALALNPEPLTLESFPSCLDHLDSQRLETLSLIDEHFLTPRRGCGPEESMGGTALVYLAEPSVLPNLKNFEMTLWNWPFGETFVRALVEVISARRRDRYVEVGRGEEQGEEAGSQVCLGDEDAVDSSGTPQSCLRHVHIAFSNPSTINIVDELRHRRVDLYGEPFSLILDYPKSREVVGRVSEGFWVEWR